MSRSTASQQSSHPRSTGEKEGCPSGFRYKPSLNTTSQLFNQVETWSHDDTRLHAASCILQVFKLKGADRKHKQDREKLSKRPDSEKEKFSPQYDCTMLTDLSVDSIFTPPSRGISPAQVTKEDQSFSPPPTQSDAADPPAVSSVKPPPPSLPAPPNPKSGSGSLAR